MLVHALALHLAMLDPVAAPEVHLLPPLALAAPPALTQSAPAPPAAPASPPRAEGAGLGGTYAAALAGTLISDLVFGGAFVLGVVNAFGDFGFFEGRRASLGWAVFAAAAATGFVFVTPAATVWAAQMVAGSGDRGGLAYLAVFAVRAVGFAVAAAFPPILIVTELVAAPLVAAAIVRSGARRPRPAGPPDFPDEPAPGASPTGSPPLSRPLCPDAALAART